MAIEVVEGYLSNFSFRNNKNLRPAGVTISYTEEMIQELIKCKLDPVYFIKKYVKVVHVDRGLVPFELYPYQEQMIQAYHDNRRVLTMLFRQAGKTTTTAAFITHYMLFNDDKRIAILANKASTAREILSRISIAYEQLPLWMQSGVVEWNKGSVELENGSRVIAAATSSSGIRGQSVSLLYCDEFAHVDNHIADEFFASVYPTISSGKETKILISSTPNGYNLFHKFWSEAEKGLNGFVTQRFDWWEHPERDQKWADEQKSVLGELKYSQEVQMEFLGSSRSLLTGDTLRSLTHDQPIKVFRDKYQGLKIYEQYSSTGSYVMTVDVSRGRHLDASAFHVYNVTEYPFRIAATYNNNDIPPLHYAAIIHQIAKSYNDAYILVEVNDIGGQVADELYTTYEYENMFWTKSGELLGKKGADPYPGIRTTKKTKRIGCANLKDIIEKQQLIVNDFQTIQELSTFVQADATGSYAADEGFHDDMVMCMVLFAWLISQAWFKDLTDKNIRDKMYAEEVAKLENDLCLDFGFSDGVDYYDGLDRDALKMLL